MKTINPITPGEREAISESLKRMSPDDIELMRLGMAYDPRLRKYASRIKKANKSKARQSLKDWWWSKGILLVDLILSLIAAVTAVIALLR